MKKILGLSALVFLFSMCSTEIELLDDWKETCVVYGLMDQTMPKQYVRIQKTFLGPNNAYDMAQQYDSINYINVLDVKIEQLQNGNVINTFQLQPDTFYNKQYGDFYAPMQVIYSFDTPSGLSDQYQYRLKVYNSATGNTCDATTSLIEDFNIISPSVSAIGFTNPNPNASVEIKWQGSPSARIYQLGMYFNYLETDLNNVTTMKTTPIYTVGSLETTLQTANGNQSMKMGIDNFYRFVALSVPDDNNVISREAVNVDFVVYAGGNELNDYIKLNGVSTGIAQERPSYTNINNGLGVFSSRTYSTRTYGVSAATDDSLSYGRFTCHLKFKDRNGVVMGCQ
jgi:hypothetical protein